MKKIRFVVLVSVAVSLGAVAVACGDYSASSRDAGSGGLSGTGGSAGSAGLSGTGGSSGSYGSGGGAASCDNVTPCGGNRWLRRQRGLGR